MWIDLKRVLVFANKPGEIPFEDAKKVALGPHFTWEEVLAQPCVALLGEAGTGKTTELRALAERLPHGGRAWC